MKIFCDDCANLNRPEKVKCLIKKVVPNDKSWISEKKEIIETFNPAFKNNDCGDFTPRIILTD
jgi:hypothetical protein